MKFINSYRRFKKSKLVNENQDELQKIIDLIDSLEASKIELAISLSEDLGIDKNLLDHYKSYFVSYNMDSSIENLKKILLSISNFLKIYSDLNYQLTSEGKIDIEGNLDLSYNNLTSFPVKFGKITGSLNISKNSLTTLVGGPEEVTEGFYCNDNKLSSLVGCPKTDFLSFEYNQIKDLTGCPEGVRSLQCKKNELVSLEGCPKSLTRYFDCSHNQLENLIGLPDNYLSELLCNNNKLNSLEGSPKVVGTMDCSNNDLESLKNLPLEIEYSLRCENNKIKILKDDLIYTNILGKVYLKGNPIEKIYAVFNDFKKFKGSLDHNYLQEPNIIVRFKFVDACEELDITPPDNIEGYEMS